MRDMIRTLVALTFLLTVNGNTPQSGYCIENQCFAVFQDPVDFATAQQQCEVNNGLLMTVKSSVSHDIISILLGNLTEDHWIGLWLPGEQCPDSASVLRGYKWITGDDATDFHNWGAFDDGCTSKCVSVSKDEFKWTTQSCDSQMAGFLCEYNFPSACKRFPVKDDESVIYRTPLGFEGEDLLSLPLGSTATHQPLETKYICFSEQWMQAPWNCEIENGGCEHDCLSINQLPVCTCPLGTVLNDNRVTCDEAKNDPCLDLGCAQVCYQKNDSLSYACMCHHGFQLAEDGKGCQDIDDCIDDRQCPGENFQCVNTIGAFECVCSAGFTKTHDGQCVDLDECRSAPCEHVCTNTPGSYNCSCYDGFIPKKENPSLCQLHCGREECRAECDPNNEYECRCPPGYIFDVKNDESYCVDVNECDNFYCDQNCRNTYGGHVCSCDKGYDLVDGYKCVARGEGSGFTIPYDLVTPTVTYPTARPSNLTAGGLLGIIVCVVVVILVIVFLVCHILKRRGKPETASALKSHGGGSDSHDLEQVTTEKHDKPSSDRHLTMDT